MIALSIENLEFLEELSPGRENIYDSVFKDGRMAISPNHESCLMELTNLLAAFFFDAEIGKYQWQNLKQRIRSKRPYDHWALSRFGGFAKDNASSKPFNEPRENGKFCVSDFQGDNPSLVSSFSFWFPVLNAKTPFSIDKTRQVSKIGLRRSFALFEFFQGFKKLLVNSIVHMNFLFDSFDKFIAIIESFFSYRIPHVGGRINDCFNQRKAQLRRFLFEDQIWFNLFKYMRESLTTRSSPNPRWFSVFSLFWLFAKSSAKFMKKIFTYRLKSGRNFQMARKHFSAFLLCVSFSKNRSVSVDVSSKICKFHERYFTDKPNLNQRPQRLTGWGLRNETCYSLNSWETMRGWVEVPVPPFLNKDTLFNYGHKSNRMIIDAQMAFFGTGCIINEQVILQDQEGVLAWVSERLAA